MVQGKRLIERDGRAKKFVAAVEEHTFAGWYAAESGRDVQYITERCVFRLTKQGLELTEVAPGIDIDKDILDRMEFAPIVRQPKTMDARNFAAEPMALREDMLSLPLEARMSYDDERNILFLNFEGLEAKTLAQVEEGNALIRGIVEPLGHKVYAVINHDDFKLDPAVEDAYFESARQLAEKYFLGITRFTTSAFMKTKLGDLLGKRGVAPHIFESEDDTKAAVRDILLRTPRAHRCAALHAQPWERHLAVDRSAPRAAARRGDLRRPRGRRPAGEPTRRGAVGLPRMAIGPLYGALSITRLWVICVPAFSLRLPKMFN